MVFKSKLFVLLVFGIAVLAVGVLAATLSEDIFPLSLEGIPLTLVEEEPPDNEVAEDFSARYESEEKEIDVFFSRMRSVSIAKSIEQGLISVIKEEYALMFDKVDWESSKTAYVAGYQTTAIRFRVYSRGNYLDGGFIFVAVKDYVILIQIFGYEKPSFSELERVLEIFINKIPENGDPPPPGEQEEEEEEKEEEKEEEEGCGNNKCEYWIGEDCNNCRYDCDIPSFCCLPDLSYIYAHDYHNKNYEIHEPAAGLIPRGAILIFEGVDEDDLPLVVPKVCDGGIKIGECVYNYDCPSGFCTVENWCVKTYSEKFQEIKNQDMVEKIYEDQNSYKEEFVEAYEMIEGGIAQVVIKDAKLNIRLEVQGNTAGKVPKVSEGDEVEVRLEIENNSNKKIDLRAKLVYSDFGLEENKYTICLEEKKDIICFIGSSKAEPEFIELPKNSKLYIYSKQIPKQTGYLDVQAIVYYDEDKEAKISNFILVEERPCNWWPICL